MNGPGRGVMIRLTKDCVCKISLIWICRWILFVNSHDPEISRNDYLPDRIEEASLFCLTQRKIF